MQNSSSSISPSSLCNFSKDGTKAVNKSIKIEALINGIIPNEKALKCAPPPPEYMLITHSEFLVSNCENAFFKASWSIPANGI